MAIRNNQNIKGIYLSNVEVKQTLFADDASFFLDGCKRSFETLISTLDKFSDISCLRLNQTKCNVMRVGSLKNSTIKFCHEKPFNWSN